MNARDIGRKGDAGFAASGDQAGAPPLWGRKSVLTGIAASVGFAFANLAQPPTAAAVGAVTVDWTWTPSTSYALGQQVVSPDNDVVSANIAHTSSAAYATDTMNWSLSKTYAPHSGTPTREGTPLLAWQVNPVTAGSAKFDVFANSFANSGAGEGTKNRAMFLGFNSGRHAQAPVVAGKCAMVMGFEDNYYDPVAQKYGPEWYVEYWSPDGTSVQMLRPFYTRIEGSDSNATNSAVIHIDMGTDGAGHFDVWAGKGNPVLFTVQPNLIQATQPMLVSGQTLTLQPPSGAAGLYLSGASQANIVFSNAGTQGWVFQAESVDRFVVGDRDGRMQLDLAYGATAAEALTAIGSSLRVDGNVGFFTTTPISKRATTTDATDLATVITLANALKADLIAYGLKS